MERLHAQFVDNHRADLIQKVTAVMPIADALMSAGIIQSETHSDNSASTNQDKMRELLDALRTVKAESAFYNSLKQNKPFLVVDLEHQDARFVNHHRSVLIQRVTAVMPIADALMSAGIIQRDTYSDISAASTNQDKMRELLDALRTVKAESAFYNSLKQNKPFLVVDLEHQDARFVNHHRSVLIRMVKDVMPIADALVSDDMIDYVTYSKIRAASTNQDKMSELLDAQRTDKAKSDFYNFLKEKQPLLVVDLEHQGVQQGNKRAHTSSEVLENKSRPQNAETLQVQTIEQKTEEKQILWNKSSIIHSKKIEELLKKTDIKKVKNLSFYKDEKYIIGSGGSSTVYLGLSEDGTEVAIKRITKNPKNNKDFENELKLLRDLKLESKYIVRYVTLAEDDDFYHLANQLCEYDLEDYMKDLRRREKEQNDKEHFE